MNMSNSSVNTTQRDSIQAVEPVSNNEISYANTTVNSEEIDHDWSDVSDVESVASDDMSQLADVEELSRNGRHPTEVVYSIIHGIRYILEYRSYNISDVFHGQVAFPLNLLDDVLMEIDEQLVDDVGDGFFKMPDDNTTYYRFNFEVIKLEFEEIVWLGEGTMRDTVFVNMHIENSYAIHYQLYRHNPRCILTANGIAVQSSEPVFGRNGTLRSQDNDTVTQAGELEPYFSYGLSQILSVDAYIEHVPDGEAFDIVNNIEYLLKYFVDRADPIGTYTIDGGGIIEAESKFRLIEAEMDNRLVHPLLNGFVKLPDNDEDYFFRFDGFVFKIRFHYMIGTQGSFGCISFIKQPMLDFNYQIFNNEPQLLLDNLGVVTQSGELSNNAGGGSANENSTLTKEESKKLDEYVKKLVEIFTTKDDGAQKSIVSVAEPIVLAGIAISAQQFWIRLFAGIGAAFSMTLNVGLIETVGDCILNMLFGTNDIKQSSIYTAGLKENLIKNKLYELISFMLIPFSTDLDLTVGQIEILHVRCAERINGLDMFSAILEASTYIGHAAQHLKETGTIVGFCLTTGALTDIVSEFSLINQTYILFKNDPRSDFDISAEIQKVSVFLVKVNNQLRMSRSPSESKYLSLISFILGDIFSNYTAREQTGKLVPSAFCFSLFGESQIGKSTLVMYIMEHIKKLYGDDDKKIKTASGLQKTPEQFVNGDEYAVLDDVSNVNPEFTQVSPLELILRLKNNICTPLEQAELSKKGKVNLVLKVLGLTTNISDWHAGMFTIKEASMMLRGDIHVRCELKPEYIKNGKFDSAKVRKEQVEKGTNEPIDVWEVTLYEVVVLLTPTPIKHDFFGICEPPSNAWKFQVITHNGKLMQKIDLPTLFEYLGEKAIEHRQRQLDIVASANSTDYDVLYCYACRNLKTKCICLDTSCIEEQQVVQSGVLTAAKRGFSDMISPVLTKLTSNVTEKVIDDTVAGYSGSVSGVFGINITSEKLIKRIKALFQLALHYLEESKRLHFLTLMPEQIFDKIPVREAIIGFETDKIARLSVKAVVNDLWVLFMYMFIGMHFGLVGIFFMFNMFVLRDTIPTTWSSMIDKYVSPNEDEQYIPIGYRLYLRSLRFVTIYAAYLYFMYCSILNIYINVGRYDMSRIFSLGLLWHNNFIYRMFEEQEVKTDGIMKKLFFELFGQSKVYNGFLKIRGLSLKSLLIRNLKDKPLFVYSRRIVNFVDENTDYNTQKRLRNGIGRFFFKFSKLKDEIEDYPSVFSNDVLILLCGIFISVICIYLICKAKRIYEETSDNYVTKSYSQIVKIRNSYAPYRGYIERLLTTHTSVQSGSEFWKKGYEVHNFSRSDIVLRSESEIAPALEDGIVCLADDNNKSVMGLVLRTGRMLIPSHYVEVKSRQVTAIRYNSTTRGNSRFTVQVSPLMCRAVGVRNDYVILDFFHGGHFADITSLFPDDDTIEVKSGTRYHKSTQGDLVKTETFQHTEAIIKTCVLNIVSREIIRNVTGFSYKAYNADGLCGAPILSGRKKSYIKGIHIAGSTGDPGLSYGVPVRKSDLLASLALPDKGLLPSSLAKIPLNEGPFAERIVDVGPSDKSSMNYIGEHKQFEYLGRLGGFVTNSPCCGVHSVSDDLEKAGMPRKWEQRGINTPTYKTTDNWAREVTSPTGDMDPAIMRRAQQDFFKPLLDIIHGDGIKMSPLTRSEIVDGIPGSKFIHGLDGSTGAGWGFSGVKSDYMKEVDGKRIVDKLIWDKMTAIENTLLRDEYPVVPSQIFLKGENGPIGKDARIATACNFAFLCVLKKYIGPVLELQCQNREISECAVGMNPYGSDVDKLVSFLDQGVMTKYCCWDFKKFDQRIVLQVLSAMLAGYVKLADAAGYNKRSSKIMSGVLAMICNPTVNMQGDLLVFVNMMMSGTYGTSHFDSNTVSGLLRCCFFEQYGIDNELQFRDWIHLVTYGDDSILSLRGLWRFGAVTFAEFCGKLGVEVTSADKTSKLTQFVSFSSLTFLSRSFRYCKIRKRWVAPLCIDSIYKPLHVYIKSAHIKPDDVLAVNFDNAIVEMCLYSENEFNYHLAIWRKIDKPVMKNVEFLNRSYKEMINYLENRNNPVLLPTLKLKGNVAPDPIAQIFKKNSFKTMPTGVKVQSGIIKEVGEHDVQETFETHEQEAFEYVGMDLGSRDNRADTNLSLNEFLERPIVIERYSTVASASYAGFVVDPWHTLLSNARNSNRISNYANFAADIELTVLVTATPFYYGQMVLMYLPTWGDDMSTIPNTAEGNIMAFQQHYLLIDISEDKAGKLVIPFFYGQEYLNLSYGNPQDIGKIDLRPVVPVRYVGDPPVDPVTITVMGRFINIRTRGLTQRNINTIVPQSGELDDKKVSKTASAVSAISSSLTSVPIIGRYARATELISSGVGAIAGMFGFSRPYSVVNYEQMTPKTTSQFAVTNIGDRVDKLTVDVRQELSIDPLLHNGPDYDPLAISTIAMKKCYWTTFEWSPLNPYSSGIGFVRVDPTFMYHNTTTDTYYIPSLAAACIPFDFYTGSIKLTFVAVCSRFHRGRLLITYDPHDNDIITPPGINTNTNLAYELDLEQSKEFSIVVESSREWSYNTMYGFVGGQFGFNDYFSGTSQAGNANSTFGNGCVNLTVLNPLSAPPSSGNLPSVKIMVFAEAMPDFRVGRPNNVVGHLYPAMRVQSGVLNDEIARNKGSGNIHDAVDLDYMGETIHSLRELCKRYTFLRTFNPNDILSTHIRRIVYPAWPFYRGEQADVFPGDINNTTPATPVDYNYTVTPFYQYCGLMYHAARGSIRYKYIPVETIGSARRDLKGYMISWIPKSGPSLQPVGYSSVRSTLESDFCDSLNVSHTGIAYNNYIVNPVTEAEIPYQTKYLMSCVRTSSEVDYFHRVVFTQEGLASSADDVRASIYTAAGEDFQVYWFRGLPEMKFEGIFPPSLN